MAFQAGVEGSLRQLDACVNSLKLTGSGEGLIELGFVRAIGTDFVPRMVSMFLQHMPIKTLKLESPGWQRLFYIATLKDYYLAPVVERFRQFVMDHAEL